eukprot:Opistho-2@26671
MASAMRGLGGRRLARALPFVRLNHLAPRTSPFVFSRSFNSSTASTGASGSAFFSSWTARVYAATGAAALSGIGAYGIAKLFNGESNVAHAEEVVSQAALNRAGRRRPDLRDIHADEVAQHKTSASGMWVIYKEGVYDVTQFVEQHPGGKRILMAVGGSIEPFWKIYTVHATEETIDILESMRVGNLHADDFAKQAAVVAADSNDPYAQEPERHPALVVMQKQPFNGETPAELLVDKFITPNGLFFVRNHLPVPAIDEKSYALEIDPGHGKPPIRLTLSDIKRKFPKHHVVASLQCTGNRRKDMNSVKKTKGLEWTSGAMSNAEWAGAKLRDVLRYAGVGDDYEKIGVEHIQFEGADKDAEAPYGASIPVSTAMRVDGDVILAYEMNGVPLPRDHGFPIRVLVPGTSGARNVKWLTKIVASSDESQSFWQQKDYKSFSPSVDWDNVEQFIRDAPAVQELPVQSAICVPPADTLLEEGTEYITMKGYAYSGGGRGIIRVDVSVDGGKSWFTANLNKGGIEQKHNRGWAWALWEADVPLPKERPCGEFDLCCKAVDSSYNTQPDTIAPEWNLRGILTNAWHRVHVQVECSEAQRKMLEDMRIAMCKQLTETTCALPERTPKAAAAPTPTPTPAPAPKATTPSPPTAPAQAKGGKTAAAV